MLYPIDSMMVWEVMYNGFPSAQAQFAERPSLCYLVGVVCVWVDHVHSTLSGVSKALNVKHVVCRHIPAYRRSLYTGSSRYDKQQPRQISLI